MGAAATWLGFSWFGVDLQHTQSVHWKSPPEDCLIRKLLESPFMRLLKGGIMVVVDAVLKVLSVLILSVFVP